VWYVLSVISKPQQGGDFGPLGLSNSIKITDQYCDSIVSRVQRMPEIRAAKKIFKWNPLTTRPRGRPKHRWEDNIIQDLGQMKIRFG